MSNHHTKQNGMYDFQTSRGGKKETSINPKEGREGELESTKIMTEMDGFYILGNTKQIFIVIVQIQKSLPRSFYTEMTRTHIWASGSSQQNEMDIKPATGDGPIRGAGTFPPANNQSHSPTHLPFHVGPQETQAPVSNSSSPVNPEC